MRRISFCTSPITARLGLAAGSSLPMMSTTPAMPASGFRISCANPAANSPSVARCSARAISRLCSSAISSRFTSSCWTISLNCRPNCPISSPRFEKSTRALKSPRRTRPIVPINASSGRSIRTSSTESSTKHSSTAQKTAATRIHSVSGTSCERNTAYTATILKARTPIMGIKTFHCQRIPVAHRTNWGSFMSVSHQRPVPGASHRDPACANPYRMAARDTFRHILSTNFPAAPWSSSKIVCIRPWEAGVPAPATFDLVVIGCGPAGEKAGAQAAYFGKRVAVIEGAPVVGGSCINSGTVPSKTLRESALYFSGLKQRGLYGIDYSLKENLTVHDFMHHEREVVEMERARILKNLQLHKIDLVRGQAAFEDPHTVVVSGSAGIRKLYGDVIVISTGSKPHRPAEIAFDDVRTFDSDTFLQLERIPKSLAVIGGGVIGCEYASIFMALGVDVTLVDGRDRVLPFLDAEISGRLRDRFATLGMHLWFNERPIKAENTATHSRLTMKSGKVLEAEAALFAAGRRAAVDGLALEKAGLALSDKGYMAVDANYRTPVPHIYAAGDVIGFPALASTSMEQGRVAVCHAFGLKYKQRVASLLPMGIYTIPEISAAGETEESCKEKKIECVVGRALYENNARGHITGDTAGMLKLIFARADKKLLGVSMIGENATEL